MDEDILPCVVIIVPSSEQLHLEEEEGEEEDIQGVHHVHCRKREGDEDSSYTLDEYKEDQASSSLFCYFHLNDLSKIHDYYSLGFHSFNYSYFFHHNSIENIK